MSLSRFVRGSALQCNEVASAPLSAYEQDSLIRKHGELGRHVARVWKRQRGASAGRVELVRSVNEHEQGQKATENDETRSKHAKASIFGSRSRPSRCLKVSARPWMKQRRPQPERMREALATTVDGLGFVGGG